MNQTPWPLSLQSCSEGQNLSAAEVKNPVLDSLWASGSTLCLLPTTLGVHCGQTLPQPVPGCVGFTVIGGMGYSRCHQPVQPGPECNSTDKVQVSTSVLSCTSWWCECCAFLVKLRTKRLCNYALCQKGSLEPVRGNDAILKRWSYHTTKKYNLLLG